MTFAYHDPEANATVHRIERERLEEQHIIEARTTVDELIRRGHQSAAHRKAAADLQDMSAEIARRKLEAAQRIRERFQWEPVASCATFEIQTCTHCGSESSMFRGFGTVMRQKSSNVDRVVAASCIDRGLPFVNWEIPSSSPACADCIGEQTEPALLPAYEFHPQRKESSDV